MKKRRSLVDLAISYGVIQEKDRSIYEVAISLLFFSLFTWGTLLLLGVLFHELYGCILFLLFHIPLRVYAGGFHQNTRVKCYIQSLAIFFLLIAGSMTTLPDWIAANWIIFMVPSFAVIWFLSPVESANKPLKTDEYRHHKLVSRVILVVELAALFLFSYNNLNTVMYFSFSAIVLVAVQLVMGFAENKWAAKNLVKD